MSLESNHINHANSNLIFKPNYPEIGIEGRSISNIVKIFSARLISQKKLRYQTLFSARFDKQGEDNQVLDEIKLIVILLINHNLTETDLDHIDNESALEHQIQAQELKDSGWRIDKINSMTVYFYKTGEMNGRSNVKIPLRSSAILNIENNDKHCFLWSILAHLHPCKNNHPNRVSSYRHYFNELNIDGFDFSNGFKCSDMH